MHPDDNHIRKMREIMGFLIGAQRPPEDPVLGRPPFLVGENAFDAVDDRMHHKIHQAKPAQARSEDDGDDAGPDSVNRRVRE